MKISIKKGFTLIELLVVISIIGLLSSVVLASLKSARAKAKDSKRIQSLTQIRTALELFNSKYGHYPNYVSQGYYIQSNGCSPAFSASITVTNSADDNWIIDSLNGVTSASLKGEFIPSLPSGSVSDPNYLGCYAYYSNGIDYKLTIVSSMESMCQSTAADIPFCYYSLVGGNSLANSATIYSTGGRDFSF